MASRAKPFNEQLGLLYQDAVDNIRFLKQQQWSVTNYAALIYGAVLYIFSQGWMRQHLDDLMLIVVAALITNLAMLWQLQISIDKFRKRLEWVYQHHFTEGQQNELMLGPRHRKPSLKIAYILAAFSIMGAAVTLGVVVAAPGCESALGARNLLSQ